MEWEVGGGIGMGNTCKPMAVSFQCMTKFTTNKKKKKRKRKKKKKENQPRDLNVNIFELQRTMSEWRLEKTIPLECMILYKNVIVSSSVKTLYLMK